MTPSVAETSSGPEFVRYFGPLLDAYRALGRPGRAPELADWLRENGYVSEEELQAKTRAGHSVVRSRMNWARFYLAHAGVLEKVSHGLWRLTPTGQATELDANSALELFRTLREEDAWGSEHGPSPDGDDEDDLEVERTKLPPLPQKPIYWFVGASWGPKEDQTDRFLREGIWENGHQSQFTDKVRAMRPGERIAIKASFTRKRSLPFDIHGATASVMSIRATGTILENMNDGRRIRVAWDPQRPPRDWYFYTYRITVAGADPGDKYARRLIDFTFNHQSQDHASWLSDDYWAGKYGLPAPNGNFRTTGNEDAESVDQSADPAYSVADIVAEGGFVPAPELEEMLARLRDRKNIVLQGPPGTGKTWLARRLAQALIGEPAALTQRRIRAIQFHPTLSYEDFVRGWRPSHDGKLGLVDGVFLEAVEAARCEPDLPLVVVIEEINRGNPAQIFGELLTLLEHDKRTPDDGLALAYRRKGEEPLYLPPNLHLVGTMNIADRSLALVDLALRRRFSFFTLSPQFGEAWMSWCQKEGQVDPGFLASLRDRVIALNREITQSLGAQFAIGHSFFTPRRLSPVGDPMRWLERLVVCEIGPLLDEYFYDQPERARELRELLLRGP